MVATTLPILTFHTFDDRRSVISFPADLFHQTMNKLNGNGYRTIKLMEAIDSLQQKNAFPDHSFVITFDDGYQTVYHEAFPVLKRYQMSATVFLTVGEKRSPKPNDRLTSLNGRPMLSWKEIQEMHLFGINFGAHTLTHPYLTRLSVNRIQTEILDSKAIVEDTLNTSVTCFAYPYGRYNDQISEFVRQHFTCACSDNLGFVHADSDLYALERVDAYYLRTEKLFDLMLTGLFPWYIRTRRIPRWVRRTIQNSSG